MLKLIVLASMLLVAFCNLGNALECHKCERCEQNDPLEKQTCQDKEQCYTSQRTSWNIGGRVVSYTRGCTATKQVCEEKYAAQTENEEKYGLKGPLVADYVSSQFDCSYCDSELCNDASHGIVSRT